MAIMKILKNLTKVYQYQQLILKNDLDFNHEKSVDVILEHHMKIRMLNTVTKLDFN